MGRWTHPGFNDLNADYSGNDQQLASLLLIHDFDSAMERSRPFEREMSRVAD